jgi:hypothetical protein
VLVAGSFGDSNASSAEVFDPASGSWTMTGSLATGHFFHTATLLPDGRVLVAGGVAGFFPTTTTELYDRSTGSWTTTGSLQGARSSHTATLLPDGRVLVAAGSNNDFYEVFSLDTAELYDPANGTWTATGSLAAVRSGHTATLLPNGKVLVTGGVDAYYGTYEASAELYDRASGVWMMTGSLAPARVGHTATLLPSGQVLVAGGINFDSGILTSAELYDPASETWTATGDLNTARTYHTATLLSDGEVLVVGGDGKNGDAFLASAELYDPETEIWTATGSLATGRDDHTATLLPDSTVLVAGGGFASNSALDSAELYVRLAGLLNISTRLDVQTGDDVLIGGFIITGSEPEAVVVRGMGPSLAMPGALADPIIEVHDSSGALLASNDNWKDDPSQQHVIDAGLAPTSDLESALWGVLNPDAYTVILKGNNGGTGVGLVEVYDVGEGSNVKLANISTRGRVQTDDNVLIGGLIVGEGTGNSSAKIVVRALGPSLAVADPLSDPSLELHDASGTLIDSNDDWKTRADGSSQQAEIEATTIPPNNDSESALVETLPPGSYTAVVRGKNNTVGVGIVEVYNLPQ